MYRVHRKFVQRTLRLLSFSRSQNCSPQQATTSNLPNQHHVDKKAQKKTRKAIADELAHLWAAVFGLPNGTAHWRVVLADKLTRNWKPSSSSRHPQEAKRGQLSANEEGRSAAAADSKQGNCGSLWHDVGSIFERSGWL